MSIKIIIEGIEVPETSTEATRQIMGENFRDYEDNPLSFYSDSDKYLKVLKDLCRLCFNRDDYKSAKVFITLLTDAQYISDKIDSYLDLEYDTKTTSLLFSKEMQASNIKLPDIHVW